MNQLEKSRCLTPSSTGPSRSHALERPSTALGLYSPTSSFGRPSGGNEMPPGEAGEGVLPWSGTALASFRDRMRAARFQLLDPSDTPKTARMDAVFSLPPDLWPVLPPGGLYCLETHDPRVGYTYLQHSLFPDIQVRLGTYYGKWSSAQVDVVVCWRPPPSDSAWRAGGAPPPVMPWETRQVLAHTTRGEYQYSRTRMRFRAAKSALRPHEEPLEWSDAHGVDHPDTKAANECAARNSDKDRDAHLIDPPKPNTWGEHARRPLIGALRNGGGGAYSHHVMYDHSGVRTSCGRRVPAGYFFTLIPSAAATSAPQAGGGGGIRPPSPSAAAAAVRRPPSPGLRTLAPPPRPHSSLGFRPTTAIGLYSNHGGAGPRSPSVLGGAATAAAGGGKFSAAKANAFLAAKTSPASPSPSPGTGPGQWLGQRRATNASGGGAVGPSHGQAANGGGGAGLSAVHRWRTYGVPFSHPVHRMRAAELAAMVAAGQGSPVESDTAAVIQVAEEELRLPRPFLLSPLVLRHWADVPRLYAEHWAAARALMPVSDEAAANSSKLHILLYHLQHAATLEYDRLDAKLALLPAMARLGRQSAEIDAWLQVIVEHASYLYEKLQLNNPERWPQQQQQPQSQPSTAAANSRAASPSPSPFPSSFPDPLAPSPYASSIPDPTASTNNNNNNNNNNNSMAFGGSPAGPTGRSSTPAPSPSASWPALVPVEEWAGILRIMDACRHAQLYEQWVRLRPYMSGTALPSAYARLTAVASAAGGDLDGAAGAADDDGSGPPPPPPATPAPFAHGPVNGELLEYLHEDLEEMAAEDFEPLPPPLDDFPPPRGWHGEGPPPPDPRAVAAARRQPRARRRRGGGESALPEAIAATDVYHFTTKDCQVTPRLAQPDLPRTPDAGRVSVSQAAVERAQASREYKTSREADVRKAMRRARGLPVSDDGAGDDAETMSVGSAMTGMTGMTGATGFTRADSTTSRRSSRSLHGGPRRRGAASTAGSIMGGDVGIASGMACQTTPRLWEEPAGEPEDAAAARARAAEEAAESRRRLVSGRDAKTKAQAMEEARRAQEEATAQTLQPVTPRAAPVPRPDPKPAVTGAVWRQLKDGRSIGQYGPQEMAEEEDEQALEAAMAAAGVGGGGDGEDFDTAAARRRAISAAATARERKRFMPRGEMLQLFVTFASLGSRPDMVESLQRAVNAPVSAAALAAASVAAVSMARTSGAVLAAAAAAGALDPAAEMQRQRIRATAWLLGVTWRRMTTDTYSAFVCRVLGWPPELTTGMARTRSTLLIARALVRGHDPTTAPQPPARN